MPVGTVPDVPDFRDCRWDPPGARLHVIVPAGFPCVATATRLALQIEAPYARVDLDRLHLTLGWVDLPVTDELRERYALLDRALSRQLTRLIRTAGNDGLTRVPVSRVPQIGPYGVRWETDTPQTADMVAAVVRRTLADVFGAEHVRPSAGADAMWGPYLALAYAVSDAAPAPELADRLRAASAPDEQPTIDLTDWLIVEQDTFDDVPVSGGWWWLMSRTVWYDIEPVYPPRR